MSTNGPSTRWHFDHVNLAVSQPQPIVAFFGDVLGWRPGHRPAFPFPGQWLYDGDAAVLHLQTVAGAKPNATRAPGLSHPSARPTTCCARCVRAGFEFEVMRHLEKSAAQIFVHPWRVRAGAGSADIAGVPQCLTINGGHDATSDAGVPISGRRVPPDEVALRG